MTIDTMSIPLSARSAFATVFAEMTVLSKDDPGATERVARLYDKHVTDQTIAKVLLRVLPSVVDREAMLRWLEGGCLPPEAIRLQDPEADHKKSARGDYQSQRAKLAEAEKSVVNAKAKLDDAQMRMAAAREQCDNADRYLRVSVFGRFMNAVARQMAAAFALGPIWTLVRSISGYLQTDIEYENSLTQAERE